MRLLRAATVAREWGLVIERIEEQRGCHASFRNTCAEVLE
jgi:hypothetical protein